MSAAAPASPAKGAYATWYRTHTCGELRKANIGAKVTLSGAIDRYLDDATVELRDEYGKTPVRLGPEALKALADNVPDDLKKAGKAPVETIVKVDGTVEARKKADPTSPTGDVAVAATGLMVLSASKEPLVIDFKNDDLPKREQIRHRYVWLRNHKAHEAFRLRTNVLAEMRRHLAGRGFVDVETPLLANRWTPEARNCWLAIRDRNKVFALPGNRPVHGSLLMASGFDRTFEIARRFQRLPFYDAYHQPEFHVLDLNMAFVDEPDLFKPVDELLAHLWKKFAGEELKLPIPEVTYDDAMVKYGTAAPDTRFPVEIEDVTAVAAAAKTREGRDVLAPGGAARAFKVTKGADRLKEADLQKLREVLNLFPSAGLGWIVPGAGGGAGRMLSTTDLMVPTPGFGRLVRTAPTNIYEVGDAAFDDAFAKKVLAAVSGRPGDIVIVALGKDRASVTSLAGAVRAEVARLVGPTPGPKHGLVRVTRLPYYRFEAGADGGAPGWSLTGDPLTRPVLEELDGDPHQLHGLAHYLVLDGVNVGGGALRNHSSDVQLRLFKALGIDADEADARFGTLQQAFRFGVPPHGRVGIGIDRLVTILGGLRGIHEVIPLPKDEDGVDTLARTPAPIEPAVVRGYFGL